MGEKKTDRQNDHVIGLRKLIFKTGSSNEFTLAYLDLHPVSCMELIQLDISGLKGGYEPFSNVSGSLATWK
jgi:hypothetical protein